MPVRLLPVDVKRGEKPVKPVNPALAFGMYFDGWVRGQRGGLEATKNVPNALQPVTEAGTATAAKAAWRALVERRRKEVEAWGESGLSWHGELTAPMAAGLGNEHPLENGLTFTVPHGLPLLPGSSVKGVLRRAAERLVCEEDDAQGWTLSDVWYFFGYDANAAKHLKDPGVRDGRGADDFAWMRPLLRDPGDPRRPFEDLIGALGGSKQMQRGLHFRGALVCLDGIVEPKMGVEVMTPHHGSYYRGEAPPRDNESPNPVRFAAVEANAKLELSFRWAPLPTAPDDRPPGLREHGWRVLLRRLLDFCAQWQGYGAKTAVGYGRVKPNGGGGGSGADAQAGGAWDDGTETWEGVRLSWNPGPKELTLTAAGKTAKARLADAERLIASLPEDAQKRLKKRRELSGVRAVVSVDGNLRKPISVEKPAQEGKAT